MSAGPQTLECPNADGSLRPVQARSRTGTMVRLDQCGHCGGVWFDRFELFQIDEAEARSLEKVDESSLREPHGASGKPLCPRCRKPLAVFTDPNIPANIQMLFCEACEGFWVNHGVVAGYAHYREAGRKRPDPKLAAEYEQMLRSTSEKNHWQGIEAFGNRLGGSSRDFLTGLPLDGSPAQLERIDRAQDTFFTAMGTVMRLLFGWL